MATNKTGFLNQAVVTSILNLKKRCFFSSEYCHFYSLKSSIVLYGCVNLIGGGKETESTDCTYFISEITETVVSQQFNPMPKTIS